MASVLFIVSVIFVYLFDTDCILKTTKLHRLLYFKLMLDITVLFGYFLCQRA